MFEMLLQLIKLILQKNSNSYNYELVRPTILENVKLFLEENYVFLAFGPFCCTFSAVLLILDRHYYFLNVLVQLDSYR